jgi:hypothetical protein
VKFLAKNTNNSYKIFVQDKTGSNRALFQEGQHTNRSNSANNRKNTSMRTPPNDNDIIMMEASNRKRQHGEELAEASKRRTSNSSEGRTKTSPYHKLNLWFGFLAMEQVARKA